MILVCPLTPETTELMDAAAFAALKPGAILVNCARGRVVSEPALLAALAGERLRAAALDVMVEEPLPADSPLWSHPRVFLTPHTAGETRAYEDNVLDLLQENLRRLAAGERLVNAVVE